MRGGARAGAASLIVDRVVVLREATRRAADVERGRNGIAFVPGGCAVFARRVDVYDNARRGSTLY